MCICAWLCLAFDLQKSLLQCATCSHKVLRKRSLWWNFFALTRRAALRPAPRSTSSPDSGHSVPGSCRGPASPSGALKQNKIKVFGRLCQNRVGKQPAQQFIQLATCVDQEPRSLNLLVGHRTQRSFPKVSEIQSRASHLTDFNFTQISLLE